MNYTTCITLVAVILDQSGTIGGSGLKKLQVSGYRLNDIPLKLGSCNL